MPVPMRTAEEFLPRLAWPGLQRTHPAGHLIDPVAVIKVAAAAPVKCRLALPAKGIG